MKHRTSLWRWPHVRIARGTGLRLTVSLAVSLANTWMVGGAELPSLGRPVPVNPAAARVVTLGLSECLQLALQRQPRLAAQRASLAAAEDGYRALETLCVPTILARELPVRRRQAALGMLAATVGVDQAEQETVYAVRRTYFTVIYAREQERVARGVVERLAALHEAADRSLQAGARDVTATDVDRALVYLELAQTRRLQATEGVQRGLSVLKEAIGLGPECLLEVPPSHLPQPQLRLCRDDVIAWALARRADLIQANAFVEVTSLEVDAQGTSFRPRMETFAAGADIHARQVTQESRSAEYRPGAVPPEMPSILVGSRAERMKHAHSLNERALAVAEKARNLVALEADDAFQRWEGAAAKIPHSRKAAAAGERLATSLRNDFTSGLKVRIDEVINAQVLAAQAVAQHNETLYQQALALADLERVTAGGFCAASLWQGTRQAQPALAPAR